MLGGFMTSYIPANPGFFILEAHDPAGSYSKIDIIGWQIRDGFVNAITAENLFDDNVNHPILHASGIVTTFMDREWASEEEWWNSVKES
jgi:hypothetical protein